MLARDLVDDVKTAFARASLQVAFVAYHACQMTHAIAVTMARRVRVSDGAGNQVSWKK